MIRLITASVLCLVAANAQCQQDWQPDPSLSSEFLNFILDCGSLLDRGFIESRRLGEVVGREDGREAEAIDLADRLRRTMRNQFLTLLEGLLYAETEDQKKQVLQVACTGIIQ